MFVNSCLRGALNVSHLVIRPARLVMKQPQLLRTAARGKPRALRPVTVSPAFVRGHFFRREVRIENERAGTSRKVREREVDVGIPELVIGRIHEIAIGPADSIRERPARMIQRVRRHGRSR